MSDNNPTFTEALETLAKALNINFSTLAGDLFEDVELARQAFIKRAREEKGDVENEDAGVQSRKFNSVDFWPAMDSDPDDLDAALNKLGVDKPDEEESVECGGGADCIRCAANEKARSSTEERAVEKKEPALSTWKITPRKDGWGDETVEAESLDIEPEGIYAYIGDDLVFHAPAGTYSYVRKVG